MNELTNTLDIISETGQVTEHNLPPELSQVNPGELCYENGDFWMAVENGNGIDIWKMNYELNQPQKVFTPSLP